MFLGLLWRSVMKDPFLHIRACPMLKLLPHAHVLGVQDSGHPYLMLTRSQNSCLLSIYPSSSIGRVIRHVEAPCSVLMLFSLRCWPVSLDLILTLYYLILTCINMFSLIMFLCFPFDFLLDVVYSFFFWILYVLSWLAVNDTCSSVSGDDFWNSVSVISEKKNRYSHSTEFSWWW